MRGLRQSCPTTCALFLTLLVCLLRRTWAHGVLTDPRQRGALKVQNRLVDNIDDEAPFDPYAHFPAGDKDLAKGAGKSSVVRSARRVWTPYEPLKKEFLWRAGVCGDELGKNQEHLKGGRYFYPEDDPIRVRTYSQGDVVEFESNIVTHHNGFLEFFICNIDECGGEDISEGCFKGHCEQLMRANSFCDEGNSDECGPIDEQYPGRWYLPCGPFPEGQILYGGKKGSMTYVVPENLVCDHCVIQWYWASANTCNPPGVVDYFEGKNKPNWPDCPGQGGARGGYTKVQRPCGGEKFSEEYWQCADVRVVASKGSADDDEDRASVNGMEEDNEEGDGAVVGGPGIFPIVFDNTLNGINPTLGTSEQDGLQSNNSISASQPQGIFSIGTPSISSDTTQTDSSESETQEASMSSVVPSLGATSNIPNGETPSTGFASQIDDLRDNFGFASEAESDETRTATPRSSNSATGVEPVRTPTPVIGSPAFENADAAISATPSRGVSPSPTPVNSDMEVEKRRGIGGSPQIGLPIGEELVGSLGLGPSTS